MDKFISVDRIFSKLSRDLTDEFSEDDVIEQIGEALEFIGTPRLYEETVAFVEVVNNQCDVPKGTHSIIQIGRNNRWTGIKNTVDCITPTVLQAECKVQKVVPDCSDCLSILDDAVWIDCNGKPIVDYDLAYYRPYFDLQMEYYGWSNSRYYREHFTPVLLNSSTLFNSLICSSEEDNLAYISNKFKDEYTIIERSKLRFSFREGQVAIAFNKQMIDKQTGYPLIPDSISHITAITTYIALKRAEKDFDSGRQGSESRVKYWNEKWDWYCGQASNNDKMLVGIDEHENFRRQRQYMLPRDNYYNFFGRMNESEDRVWNNNRFYSNRIIR